MPRPRIRPPSQLPGAPRSRAVGLRDYLVLLKASSAAPAESTGRHQSYNEALAAAATLRARVAQALQNLGVAGEDAILGDPTSFGTFALRATARVAELVQGLPEVEDVVPDSDGAMLAR